jgi:hypothetical protein
MNVRLKAKEFGGIISAIVIIGLAGIILTQNQSLAEPPSNNLRKRLIGTWRLVSFEDRDDPNGEWTYRYGKNPKGYFIYDETGHVTIQIMRTPPPPKFASGDDAKPTPEEAMAIYSGYSAYFGTYTVDEARHIVIHHVEGSLRPSYIGTDQERPFELSGDRLIIGDQKTWRRILERVQ